MIVKDDRGFSLIELLVVIAIVGILAGIAIPMYSSYIQKSHRAAAKSALVEAAQNMERFFSRNNTYVGASVTPASTEGGKYLLSFTAEAGSNPDVTVFKIQAVPQGGQASDNCGTLTIDHLGQRTAATAGCW